MKVGAAGVAGAERVRVGGQETMRKLPTRLDAFCRGLEATLLRQPRKVAKKGSRRSSFGHA